jgi:Zn-dependent peptidase ImmA (M78 family)
MIAEARAKEVLDKLGIKSLPVPLDSLAEALNLEIVEKPLGDALAGMYVAVEGEGFVIVSSTLPTAEKRRVIAHECGHAALQHPIYSLTLTRQYPEGILRNKHEYQAEVFAANFLIPEWAEFGRGVSTWEMAEYLGVPEELLRFRIARDDD